MVIAFFVISIVIGLFSWRVRRTGDWHSADGLLASSAFCLLAGVLIALARGLT